MNMIMSEIETFVRLKYKIPRYYSPNDNRELWDTYPNEVMDKWSRRNSDHCEFVTDWSTDGWEFYITGLINYLCEYESTVTQ